VKSACLSLLLALPALAAEPAPAPAARGRYNLILISLGNVGTAHMSLYGYGRPTTPQLDRWADDAVVFENAFSPASWTLPVGTSLFTSLYPFAHRVTARGARNALSPAVPTLPEILKRAGYATAAFTGGLDYYKGFGHMRGFDTAPDNPDFSGYETTLPQASRWLSEHERERFFLFIHGYDAHCPFAPPAPFRGTYSRRTAAVTVDESRCARGVETAAGDYAIEAGSRCELDRNTLECLPGAFRADSKPVVIKRDDIDYLRDLYDESVLGVDAKVGKFLASLSTQTLAQSVIVVYCEHGEMFAKHGRFGRPGAFRGAFYDDVLRVPLLVRLPAPVRGRVRALVELTDVMPTVLDLLGLPADSKMKMQGKDLRPLLEGKDAPVHDFVYAGMTFDLGRPWISTGPVKECSAIRDRDWKLIREEGLPRNGPHPHGGVDLNLFHVSEDPGEQRDAAAAHPDVVARLLKKLQAWRRDCPLGLPSDVSTQEIPPSLLQHAREHGYW
jgi:arylsulfatase A-like enzyme